MQLFFLTYRPGLNRRSCVLASMLLGTFFGGCSNKARLHVPKERLSYESPLQKVVVAPVKPVPMVVATGRETYSCSRNADILFVVPLEELETGYHLANVRVLTKDGKTISSANLARDRSLVPGVNYVSLSSNRFPNAGEFTIQVVGIELKKSPDEANKKTSISRPSNEVLFAEHNLVVSE